MAAGSLRCLLSRNNRTAQQGFSAALRSAPRRGISQTCAPTDFAVLGVVLRALYDNGARHTRIQSVPRFRFFGRRQAMPAGDGGRPMTDAHGGAGVA